MPHYISPLDETFIRFDAAASLMASRDQTVTKESVLDMLVRAMWQGRFDPSDALKMARSDESDRENPENWLHIPIVAPDHLLTAEQVTLKPRPYEYYGAGRGTVISVMHSEDLLPGDAEQWTNMIREGGRGPLDPAMAYDALIRTPFTKYPEAGKEYLRGIYIPRVMIQLWLDRRSSNFNDLFSPREAAGAPCPPTADLNQDNKPPPTKGRPRFSCREFIRERAVALKIAHPDMTHKIIAYKVRQTALEEYDETDVWEESTIYHKLGGYFKNLPDNGSRPD